MQHRTRQFPANSTELPDGVYAAAIAALGTTPPEEWSEEQKAAIEQIGEAAADVKNNPQCAPVQLCYTHIYVLS